MTITGGVTKLLPMIVGLNKARELMLTGEFINAAEAHRIGLVNRLVPNGEEENAAEQLARVVMSRAPLAVAANKRMVHQSVDADFEYAAFRSRFDGCIRHGNSYRTQPPSGRNKSRLIMCL